MVSSARTLGQAVEHLCGRLVRIVAHSLAVSGQICLCMGCTMANSRLQDRFAEELDAALHEAVVAIDANVLLDLYRFRPQTSQDLIKTLTSVGDRLVVPHQALREFWRRRQRSQDSPRGATKTATVALDKSGRSMGDALATWAKAVGVDDDELSGLTARVDGFLEALQSDLQQVLQDARRRAGTRSWRSCRRSSPGGSPRR